MTWPSTHIAQPDNVAAPRAGDIVIVRITGQSGTEVTGPAFDPTGRRLYFSSQRGGSAGITYEVEGPFRRVAP